MAEPATQKAIATRFRRAPRTRLATILETLTALGQIHKAQDGSYYL
jgi:hypothetical protein